MLEQAILTFAVHGATAVLWLLVGLSVVVAGITIERLIYLSRDSADNSKLSGAMNLFLKNGDVSTLQKSTTALPGFESRIISAGLEVADAGPNAVEKAMSGTATAERLRMERGLTVLATVGSNGPFIGLFGTVLGIMKAFRDLSIDSSDASQAVMAGISEALVATAIGLFVAIPAVILYNTFSRVVKARLGRASSLADLVLARIPEASAAKPVVHGN